jgi:hypothetical protein
MLRRLLTILVIVWQWKPSFKFQRNLNYVMAAMWWAAVPYALWEDMGPFLVIGCGVAGFIMLIEGNRFREPPQPGVCAACGYDLRASPDRCPECGTVPKPVRKAAKS